jgi:hypothetical protein
MSGRDPEQSEDAVALTRREESCELVIRKRLGGDWRSTREAVDGYGAQRRV